MKAQIRLRVANGPGIALSMLRYGVIGIFLINEEQELAFAQFGKHTWIDGFRFIVDANVCMVAHSGSEEMFTNELMSACDEILVAHIDDTGATIDEYVAPLRRS